jgi:membrane dipeptidase
MADPVRLEFEDPAADPAGTARRLGVSTAAVELLVAAGSIDLHLDLDVSVRVTGFDPLRHHGAATRVSPLVWQTDFPRLREGGFTGVVYDVATNPVRPAGNRLAATRRNMTRIAATISSRPADLALCRTAGDYDRARAEGKLAVWLALQGGNAVSADPAALSGPLGADLHRITLVHLTTSDLGGTSSPAGRDSGITAVGREVVGRCNDARILVDLAHAGKRTFWGALDAHARDLPPIVSHTGVEGVRPHWRNLDDDQIRAIADRGGVIGVMYQSSFLAPVRWTCTRSAILDHLDHIHGVAGQGVGAIGTDYDGFIVPPSDLPDPCGHPRLVQDMLDRGWSPERVRGVLAGNYLRVVRELRP